MSALQGAGACPEDIDGWTNGWLEIHNLYEELIYFTVLKHKIGMLLFMAQVKEKHMSIFSFVCFTHWLYTCVQHCRRIDMCFFHISMQKA